MWDLPGPGIEPVPSALAGRFLTSAPPEKPFHDVFIFQFFSSLFWKIFSLCVTFWHLLLIIYSLLFKISFFYFDMVFIIKINLTLHQIYEWNVSCGPRATSTRYPLAWSWIWVTYKLATGSLRMNEKGFHEEELRGSSGYLSHNLVICLAIVIRLSILKF